MKMSTALSAIKEFEERKSNPGYRVAFEYLERSTLRSDYFPGRDEPLLTDLEEAWDLARAWAETDPYRIVNVYVINGHAFTPVSGYEERKLNRYPRKDEQ